MTATPPPTPVKYIATVKGSAEVTLHGTADFTFWQNRLRKERLFPYRAGSRAELVLSAVESRWLGVRFRELVLTVVVSHRQNGSTRDGYFLFAAYNSSRVFAWIERTAFRTPYWHGNIEVRAADPASMKLLEKDVIFHAERASGIEPTRAGEEVWEGPIFLPRDAANQTEPGKLFHARLGGHTEVYPFSPTADLLKLDPYQHHSALQDLVESNFAGTEWHVRPQATHARSRTYARPAEA